MERLYSQCQLLSIWQDEEIVKYKRKRLLTSFDGDQVNVFRIFGLDLGKRFAKALSPATNFYISRINGRVDSKMMPIKDEIAAFWAMNNI